MSQRLIINASLSDNENVQRRVVISKPASVFSRLRKQQTKNETSPSFCTKSQHKQRSLPYVTPAQRQRQQRACNIPTTTGGVNNNKPIAPDANYDGPRTHLLITNYPPETPRHKLLSFLNAKCSEPFFFEKFTMKENGKAYMYIPNESECSAVRNLSGIYFQGEKLLIRFIRPPASKNSRPPMAMTTAIPDRTDDALMPPPTTSSTPSDTNRNATPSPTPMTPTTMLSDLMASSCISTEKKDHQPQEQQQQQQQQQEQSATTNNPWKSSTSTTATSATGPAAAPPPITTTTTTTVVEQPPPGSLFLLLEESRMRAATELSRLTRMRLEFSFKCLEDNNWDFALALDSFNRLKNMIPQEAFIAE